MRWLGIMCLGLVACSGGGTTGDGGMMNMDGGTLADGAVCPAVSLVSETGQPYGLTLAGDDLVYIDLAAGAPFYPQANRNGGAVRKVKKDGTGDMQIYAAPATRQIDDIMFANGALYMLERERPANTNNDFSRVYKLPLDGSAPMQIVQHSDPSQTNGGDSLNGLLAVDGGNLYAVRALQTNSIIWRIALAGGAETIVVNAGIDSKPVLVGTDFVFIAGQFGGAGSLAGFGRVPAAGGMVTQLGTGKCIPSDFAVGSFGILCTGAESAMSNRRIVTRFASDGTNPTNIFTFEGSQFARIGPADAQVVYLHQDVSNTGKGHIWSVPLAGGMPRIAACDRSAINRHGDFVWSGGANFATSSTLDMVTSSNELFWVETKKEGTGEKSRIYKVMR